MARAARDLHGIHPVHAVLLAAILPLFLGALLADWAYVSSYQVQWINFASWLIAGALVFGGFALVWALVELLRSDTPSSGRPLIYVLVLLATWILGLLNALIHAKDVWAGMPQGLVLSVIVTVLAVAAIWLGFAAARAGEVK